MKKILLFLLPAVLLSCAGLQHRKALSVYGTLDPEVPVYLREIKLEPELILSGISAELPKLIESLLSSKGFKLAESPENKTAVLDIFLYRENYQHDFSTIESVTLTLSLYYNDRILVYLLYTEDTDKSLDSFSWTFSLLEKNITDLAAAVHEK
ncbi:MAG: hypothetical protein JEZ04_17745 [Spirochaetales bacterium]|nr:hypothetical protein [Spirochaetales bacterium]